MAAILLLKNSACFSTIPAIVSEVNIAAEQKQTLWQRFFCFAFLEQGISLKIIYYFSVTQSGRKK